MSRKRLSMRKIREVLRLSKAQYRSVREVARSCNLARSTVNEYLRRAEEAGLSWPLPELGDAALEARLFPPKPIAAVQRPLPELVYGDKVLSKRLPLLSF